MRCGVHWKDALNASSLGRAKGYGGVHWKDALNASSLGRAKGYVSPFTLLDISLSLCDGGGGGGGGVS